MNWVRIGRGWSLGLFMLVVGPARAGQPCEDPIFLQTEARLQELSGATAQIEGWRAFLANYPDHPCAQEARTRIADLETSERMRAEQAGREAWTQESRGGVVEPNRDEFPQHAIFSDAQPLDRIRLLSEAIWLGPKWKSDYGEQNIELQMANDALWTLVIKGDLAVVSHLGLQVELPLVFGEPAGDGFQAALGNIGVGVRGIWGTRLAGQSIPWVISGGVLVGTGTSLLGGQRALLDAAAIAGAHQRHLFRFDSPDYAVHAESQIGLGDHFFGLGLTYHVFAGGEHVERILRIDLTWDWRLSNLISLGLELNGGLGDGEAVVGATENEFLLFWFASPGVRFSWSWAMAQLAVRIPLADARDWTRLITAIELGTKF